MHEIPGVRERGSIPTDRQVTAEEVLEARASDIAEWLRENGAKCHEEQRHLDANTEAREYWHHGYLMAVRDVLALLGSTSTPRH